MVKKNPFLSAKHITIRNGKTILFVDTSWIMYKKERWLIVGDNGSGKTTFAKALAGKLPVINGEIHLHYIKEGLAYPSSQSKTIALVSYDHEQGILLREEWIMDLADLEDPQLTVKAFIDTRKPPASIKGLWERKLATLSTGELRVVSLQKALMRRPRLLILDEPFNGLDAKTRDTFQMLLSHIKIPFILIDHPQAGVSAFITHILYIHHGKVEAMGTKDEIIKKYPFHFQVPDGKIKRRIKNTTQKKGKLLVSMQKVRVQFNEKTVLNNLDLNIWKGRHIAIVGRNGSGKSTLVKVITSDLPQAYAQNLQLFGKRKQDLSLWEIKKDIGVVSSDLLHNYQKNITVINVILSGFFDSIGLYEKASVSQYNAAVRIINKLDLQTLSTSNYQLLSLGQKRLILIARALVKKPKLLILDEPFLSLDRVNKERIQDALSSIAKSKQTTILLITHTRSEVLDCISTMYEIKNGKAVMV